MHAELSGADCADCDRDDSGWVEESAALAFRAARLLRPWLSDAVQLTWPCPLTVGLR